MKICPQTFLRPSFPTVVPVALPLFQFRTHVKCETRFFTWLTSYYQIYYYSLLYAVHIPFLVTYMAHAYAAMRTAKTQCWKFLYNAITSTDYVTAQHKYCPSSSIGDRPGRDLFIVLMRSPISQLHTLGLRRGYSDGKAVGNTTGLRRRLHPHCGNFPATVIMPRACPDWSKFQFLRSWHNPAEIRTTRTSIYQTWSERSNH